MNQFGGISGRLWSSLRSIFSALSQKIGIQSGRPFSVTSPGQVDYGIDGALQVGTVWACVEILTDTLASLPLFVYEPVVGGRPGERKQVDRDNELYMLLHNSPNNRHTPMQFWQCLIMNFLMRGNGYARLERRSDGTVKAMWPISSDQVTPKLLDDGTLVYEWSYNNKIVIYSEKSILHLRDKGNGIVGNDRLAFMNGTINLAISIQNTFTKLFANGNKRPGVFMLDKTLTPDQRTTIRTNFAALVEGNDTELIVLEAGAKFEALAMTPAEVQAMENRRFTVEEIARWLGVPSSLINDMTKNTSWGSGIQQIVEGFYKFRLRPMLVSFEQSIRKTVMTAEERAKYVCEFALEALLRGSLKERMEIYVLGVDHGIYTSNECRQFENLPPLAGGDTLRAQMQFTPLDKLGTVTTTERRAPAPEATNG